VRKALNLSQGELAEKLGINASAISQMETDRIKPSLDTLLVLAKNYKVNLHWLITGKGSMFEEALSTEPYQKKARLDELKKLLTSELDKLTKVKEDIYYTDVVDIPVRGEIAAGLPVESLDDELDIVTVRKSMLHGEKEEFVCLRVNGHSMEPEIRHNDLILIKQSNHWEAATGKICAVRIDGSVTLKQLVLDPDRKVIILVALNNEYKPIIVRPDEHADIQLIGYLFFLFRKMSGMA